MGKKQPEVRLTNVKYDSLYLYLQLWLLIPLCSFSDSSTFSVRMATRPKHLLKRKINWKRMLGRAGRQINTEMEEGCCSNLQEAEVKRETRAARTQEESHWKVFGT